jgi:hypothetical protein
MLRLATRLPDRPPAEAVELLLSAQSMVWYQGGVDRSPAHRALINARRRIDEERRVPADWTKVTQLDWDADGVAEAHIENRDVSIVVDPVEGLVTYVDLKVEGHPLSYLPGQPPWRVARALRGDETHRLSFEMEAVEEARDHTTVRMTRPDLSADLTLSGTELSFDYRLSADSDEERMQQDRLGPELTLALQTPTRLRVDGGPFRICDQPAAHTGHRFRFDDGRRQVVVSMSHPGDLFVTKVEGGVVAWVNWAAQAANLRASISLTG